MLLLITRKDYDHEYGLYSKELANMKKATEIIMTLGFNLNNTAIITSPFESDKKSAGFLKEKLNINREIQESELLIFGVDTAQKAEKLFNTISENIIIVACQAVMAFLLKEARKRSLKIRTYEDGLCLILK